MTPTFKTALGRALYAALLRRQQVDRIAAQVVRESMRKSTRRLKSARKGS
jgi:hypothetical protein